MNEYVDDVFEFEDLGGSRFLRIFFYIILEDS